MSDEFAKFDFDFEQGEATDDDFPPLQHYDPLPTLSNHGSPPPNPSNDHSQVINPETLILERSPSTECLHSLTDPIRAFFHPTISHKPRSKSAGHVARPPLPLTQSWRQSIDPPRAPRLLSQTSEEVERGVNREVEEETREPRAKQQAAHLLAVRTAPSLPPHLPYQHLDMHRAPGDRRERAEPVSGSTITHAQDNQIPHKQCEAEREQAESMDILLLPVNSHLQRLKDTKIPPYTAYVHSKSPSQILKERLLPIGKHILSLLKHREVGVRGEAEVDICRYIAETYWPHNVREADCLGIMEIYRNAVFLEGLELRQGGGEDGLGGNRGAGAKGGNGEEWAKGG